MQPRLPADPQGVGPSLRLRAPEQTVEDPGLDTLTGRPIDEPADPVDPEPAIATASRVDAAEQCPARAEPELARVEGAVAPGAGRVLVDEVEMACEG